MDGTVAYALCKRYINATLSGAGALKGEQGDPGKSAFDLAVEEGFSGTKAEWLESLRGASGYTPYIGDNGNWFINGNDTGTAATGTVKITSEGNSTELIIDEENCTISSVINGASTVVANFSTTASIESAKIDGLFVEVI